MSDELNGLGSVVCKGNEHDVRGREKVVRGGTVGGGKRQVHGRCGWALRCVRNKSMHICKFGI